MTLNLAAILNNIARPSRVAVGRRFEAPTKRREPGQIFKSDQLKYVQNGGKAIKSLAFWLAVIVPLLYILALFLAKGHRRRTLMTIGFAGIFAGVLVIAGRSILQGQIANALTSDASLQVTIHDVYGITTAILKDVASGVIFIGILLVAGAWFAGPARPARASRQAIAPFLREQTVATFGIVVGLLVLLFIWDPIPATGKPLGILAFTVLALLGTYILIRQTAVEFPEARSGAATHAIRTPRVEHAPAARSVRESNRLRRSRDRRAARAARRLARRGAITPDEYETAKTAAARG